MKRLLAWIDGTGRDKRFFITYLPVAGHHPYASVEPGPFAGRGDFGAYQNALYDGDRALGALVDGLRTRGLDGKTLFVIVGDHGEAFGQHDGNYGHTLSIYDENVRVPLFFAIPGVTTEHLVVPNVASVLDIAPTILDLGGAADDRRPMRASRCSFRAHGWRCSTRTTRSDCWACRTDAGSITSTSRRRGRDYSTPAGTEQNSATGPRPNPSACECTASVFADGPAPRAARSCSGRRDSPARAALDDPCDGPGTDSGVLSGVS